MKENESNMIELDDFFDDTTDNMCEKLSLK
jgi:hypothetical protein